MNRSLFSFLKHRILIHRTKSRLNDPVSRLLNPNRNTIDPVTDRSERILKVARGTRDIHPGQIKVREKLFRIITDCFKQHGAKEIDTPIFELTTLLREKYGEDSKLIYELKDHPDEDSLALRYDLTVPFARYLVQNKISTMKRYQIGKVYRLDNPKMMRGRYREFYQCDFDIAGDYGLMIPDAECIKIIADILDRLELGKFHILINHRQLLDAIFKVCGVPPSAFRSISSSIDKLDKVPWTIVRNELINEKGLTPETADRIWKYVQKEGQIDLIDELRRDQHLTSEKSAVDALNDLQVLFNYLNLLEIADKIRFTLKLARGLDYYTGLIFEAVLIDYQNDPKLDDEQLAVGSVAGGGRYDELVEKIDPKRRSVPCVGLSIGIERLLTIKEHQQPISKMIETEIFVASAEKNFLEQRMKLCSDLWKRGFKVEMALKTNPKLLDQLQYCEKNQIQLCLIIGSEEMKNGNVKLRKVQTREEFEIRRDDLINELRKHLSLFDEKNSS